MCESVSLRIIITSLIFTNISYKFFTGCKIIKKNYIQLVYLYKKYTRKHVFYGLNSANRKKYAQFYKKKGVILNLLPSVGAWLRRDAIASKQVLFSYKTATIADTKQLIRPLTSSDVSIHFVRCEHSLRSM